MSFDPREFDKFAVQWVHYELDSDSSLACTTLAHIDLVFSTTCFAKHARDKGAKWAAAKRPKKSRPSDINRKPPVYELHSMVKPPEYTISGK